MARSLRIEFADAIYHLCARGNERLKVFRDDRDRGQFLGLLERSAKRYEISVIGFVLLPNHFHLIAQTHQPNLSRWMHWLMVSYTVYFNWRHRRSGHLFQGRYKSFLVGAGEGEHLLSLSRYVHLNPVRGRVLGQGTPAERRKQLRDYRWSSYRSYAGLERAMSFVEEALVLEQMGGRKRNEQRLRYRRFVEEGLLREVENPFAAVRWQTVLGSESFAQKLKDQLHGVGEGGREMTGVRQAARDERDAEKVLGRVARHYQMRARELVQERAHGSEARNVAMWLLRQRGETLREIGERFGGIDYAAVSQRIRRLEKRAQSGKRLRRLCQMLNV